jgi:hypothetical protein
MRYRTDLRLTLSTLLVSCLAFVACDAGPPEPVAPTTPDPTEEPAADEPIASFEDAEIGPANNCRVPPQSCSASQKCCKGAVCLNDDLNPDPEQGPLSCRPCGKPDQACCGQKRATSLRALEKRCSVKNFVCPQTESADICEPCGKAFQHCCIENGKAKCKDGSKCVRTGKGGNGQEASPGLCLPEE